MEAEAEPRRWAATYTKHLKQKRKAYQDGALLLYPDSGRLVLLDDADATVDSRFLRAGERVSAGASLAFHSCLVDVREPDACSTGYATSSVPSSAAGFTSRTAHRGGGGARARLSAVNPRPPRAFVNPPKSSLGSGVKAEAACSGNAEAADSRFQEWSALYTTQLTQKAKKYHDGFVRLVQIGTRAKQIVLLNEKGEVLGSRYLKSGESMETGKKCQVTNYLIEIGEVKSQSKGVQPNSSEEPMVQPRQNSGENTSNKMGFGTSSKSMKFMSPQKFLDIEESKSEVTYSSNKQESAKIEVVSAGSTESLMGSSDSGFKEWSALYTTQLTQKAKKYHDGVLKLIQVGSHTKQIILLDEDGEVLGGRYLKSGESFKSGTKCQLPNYLIEVCEPRNQKNEPKHSLEDALSHTGPMNEENTSGKTGRRSKSPTFLSPLKFSDLQKSISKSITGFNRPNVGITGPNRTQVGTSTCTNIVFGDLHGDQSNCSINYRSTDLDKSTFSTMDNTHKFNDFADAHWDKSDCTTSHNCPEVGKDKPRSNRMDDPLEFRDFWDGKSGCSTSFIMREVGKSIYDNMDDSLRTASQILSIMKPPSEIKISQRIPSAQACSSVPSESKIALDVNHSKGSANMSVINNSSQTVSGSRNSGLSHFATQLRKSVQSCLKLETVQGQNSVSTHHLNKASSNAHTTYNHQTIMRPATFEDLELNMVDNTAFDMPNAKEHSLDTASNDHYGSSNGMREDKSGTTDKLGAYDKAVERKRGNDPVFAPTKLTCLDPKIQALIDDCPSFDLGF